MLVTSLWDANGTTVARLGREPGRAWPLSNFTLLVNFGSGFPLAFVTVTVAKTADPELASLSSFNHNFDFAGVVLGWALRTRAKFVPC